MSPQSLRPYRQAILDAAARHGVRNVRVFGSIARGDERSGSDLDLLVEMAPGRSLLDLIAFEQELEALLGRKVDVVSDGGVSPHLSHQVIAEAKTL